MSAGSKCTLGDVKKLVDRARKDKGEGAIAYSQIPWTGEEWLGVLKRRKEIKHFAEVVSSVRPDTNMRTYETIS